MLRIQGISGMTSGTWRVYRARDWSAQTAAHLFIQTRSLLLVCTGLSHSENTGSPKPGPVRAKTVLHEWANRTQYIHSMEYCPAMKKEWDIYASCNTDEPWKQIKRPRISWFPFMWNARNGQIHRDSRQIRGFQGLSQRNEEWLLMGTGFLSGGGGDEMFWN